MHILFRLKYMVLLTQTGGMCRGVVLTLCSNRCLTDNYKPPSNAVVDVFNK